LPYMAIETDYSTADLGQLSTRVAAFFFLFKNLDQAEN
ncbi:2-hydroxyacyl-CoA dehydratase family protein, partial [Klebsiella quasipneumoniae]